jgi:hypothetical protein
MLSAVVLCSALIATAFVRYNAEPAAVVVQVTGPVQVQRAGQTAQTPASVGVQLSVGDRVVIGTGAKAVLLYKSGKMEPAAATMTIAESETRQPAGRFQQVVTTVAQVATTNARTQPNRQGMIRPVPGEPIPIMPLRPRP